MGNRTRIREGK
ncbi:hypothetical protein FH589_06350 [Leptospira interrogans]|nr:hypothetical protein [Leptospira interrogans]ULG82105.1 hypothetical protein FH595_09435 [Leptospira interrogans]ULG85992.1 hypothetical protein FH594_01050 [Leptospira interrogans]ULG93973.1 hypothetical protein FH584_01175 [Leptospira interrogans]UML70583.1 hypothetical protein FH589_06350 [Leptospira interrogans]UML73912.1 hypothetical protein FH598_04580 [Leptospira interrogans]